MASNIEVERKRCLDILHLDNNAKLEDIKKSYKKLALQCHPDKNLDDPTAKDKFQKLSDAYYKLQKIDRYTNFTCSNCGSHECYECWDSDSCDESDEEDVESEMWFFRRIFIDVFSEFIFKNRFKYHGKYQDCFDDEEKEEDHFFDFIYKKYRSEGWDDDKEFELTEEDLKKFHYYEDWHKARDPKRRAHHSVRKARKKTQKMPNQPKKMSKKEIEAEQNKRNREMQQIAQQLKQKYKTEKTSEQNKRKRNQSNHRKKGEDEDHFDVQKELERQQAEKRRQEAELEKLLNKNESIEKTKEKKSKKKKQKEMKKMAKNEAEDFHFTDFPSDAFKRSPITVHTYSEEDLGNDWKRRKCVSDIDPVSRDRGLKQLLEKSKKERETKSNSEKTFQAREENGEFTGLKENVYEDTPKFSDTKSKQETKLLDKHLSLFHDLMKVQPKRHTQEQIREEKKKQLEKMVEQQKHELEEERVSSQQVHSKHIKCEISGKGTENYENTRQQFLARQREMEKRRNEEELEEIKASYYTGKKKNPSYQKDTSTPKVRANVTPIKPTPVPIPQNTRNVWAERLQIQKKVEELAPKSVTDEDTMISMAVEMSKKSAESDDNRRRWIHSMRNQMCNSETEMAMKKRSLVDDEDSRYTNTQVQVEKNKSVETNSTKFTLETDLRTNMVKKSKSDEAKSRISVTEDTSNHKNDMKLSQKMSSNCESNTAVDKNNRKNSVGEKNSITSAKTTEFKSAKQTLLNSTEENFSIVTSDSFSKCVWDSLLEEDSVLEKLDGRNDVDVSHSTTSCDSVSDKTKSKGGLQKKFNLAVNNLRKGIRSDKHVQKLNTIKDVSEDSPVIEDWDGDNVRKPENWHSVGEEYVLGTTVRSPTKSESQQSSQNNISKPKPQRPSENNTSKPKPQQPYQNDAFSSKPKPKWTSQNNTSLTQNSHKEASKTSVFMRSTHVNEGGESWENDLDSTLDMKRKAELRTKTVTAKSGYDYSVTERLPSSTIKQTDSVSSINSSPFVFTASNQKDTNIQREDNWENELDSTIDMKRKAELRMRERTDNSSKMGSNETSSTTTSQINSSVAASELPCNVNSQNKSHHSGETWENELDSTLDMQRKSNLIKHSSTGGFVPVIRENVIGQSMENAIHKPVPLDNLFKNLQLTDVKNKDNEKLNDDSGVVNLSNHSELGKQTSSVSGIVQNNVGNNIPPPTKENNAGANTLGVSPDFLQAYFKCLSDMNAALFNNMLSLNMTGATMPFTTDSNPLLNPLTGMPTGGTMPSTTVSSPLLNPLTGMPTGGTMPSNTVSSPLLNPSTGMPMVPPLGEPMSQVSPVFAFSMQQQRLKQQMMSNTLQQNMSENTPSHSQSAPLGQKRIESGTSINQTVNKQCKLVSERTSSQKIPHVPRKSKFAKFVVPTSKPVKSAVLPDSLKQSNLNMEEKVSDIHHQMIMQSQQVYQNPSEEKVEERYA